MECLFGIAVEEMRWLWISAAIPFYSNWDKHEEKTCRRMPTVRCPTWFHGWSLTARKARSRHAA
eukprot:5904222-Prorocentrum_lima.AAC.1